ncbi:MAG: histidine kinase [Bacteroidota bacterium]
MKSICITLFLIGFGFSVFSQQLTNTPAGRADSSRSPIDQSSPKVSAKDTSTGNFKTKINKVYKQLDKSPITHKYINQLDDLKEKVGNKYKRMDSSVNADTGGIGRVIALQHRITKSLKSKKEKQDSISNFELAIPYGDGRQDSSSLIYALPLLKEAEPSPQEKMAMAYVKAGSVYMGLNKTNEAILNYEKGLHIAEVNHSLAIIESALKGLSEAYTQKADVKQALFYYKQYTEIKDSLVKLKTDKVVSELYSKYENEKKQRKIQSLVLDAEKKKTELKRSQGVVQEQKQFILLTILILALIIILTITIFRQYRIKKKNNDKLLIQNNKIIEQKEALEESLTYTKQLQEALKEDLDHYMQVALRKQMNPHFIFNSLNSIQSFILQNDKLSANIYLSKFSGLMRKVLENSQHHFITLSKEIEVLKLYIELEEQRFDNKFNCFWNIAENVDLFSEKTPPLILQPYIENAIWHGLLHKEGERVLTISIIKNEEELICTVEDNGVGRTAATESSKNKPHHESLGTKITKKRIDLLNSLNKASIGVHYYDLTDKNGIACGTKVELTIPAIAEYI